MKLAFCLFNYFPFGGLQRDFLRIAKECVRRGHSVDVYTMKWEGEKDNDLSITIIPTRGQQNHIRIQRYIENVLPRVQQHDLVVGFNKMPGLDVYYAADTCYQTKARQKHSFIYRLLPRYRQLVANEAAVFKNQRTEVLLISPLQQHEFMHFYQTPGERFHLLPPGIAKDRIAPANAADIRQAMRLDWEIKNNEFLLLLVGSGFKTKGLDRALLAIAALPDELQQRVKLFVIGKDRTAIFERQAKRLGIQKNIAFLGGRNDIPAFLLAADLLVHPAYNENTGTVLLEALAAGLPVLTTDVCGYAHYIETAHAGRVSTSPFNQKHFNETLQNMLSFDQRSQWSQNGKQFALQNDLYSMPERAVDIIESLR